MNAVKELEQYLEEQRFEYRRDSEIAPFLTLGIGGKVGRIVIVRDVQPLKELLLFMHRLDIPFVLLGGGSNVVFPDRFSPLTVIINRTSHIEKLPDAQQAAVDSGVMNKNFMAWSISHRCGGLDFLAGVPGTVGGAAAVNAGSFGLSISMALQKADIFMPRTGEIKSVDRDYFDFEYRNSRFKYGDEVILRVYLSYTDTGPDEIRDKVRAKLRYRREKHPPQDVSTAGCFFKNPIINQEKVSAGKLIEQAGFRGTHHHHLEVAEAHCNFVINRGGSTFADVMELEQKIAATVREKDGITLEREVIYISPEGKKY